ncbi:Alpha-pyrone synthesis polyketide synthase-like Pks18 [Hirsutella minnesotensis 3608]|uniref:Alpha-pyrone synthesis polyketide synthase-like Pks18 n=1 Tax=Hirsutella minnesotensis 3608 TaxID=1043627 RepID=A0A0F7ZWY9_9HYPO|nr:Alpha-pyrone synthesis polyketide synthase-like Pks18 [Hirsutella minnesotensis 3608]
MAAQSGPGPLVVIDSIATGVPEITRKQAESANRVAKLMKVDQEQHKRISCIYAKTRIHTRHMAVDPLSADFDRSLTIRERMNRFLEYAAPLATDVSGRALAEAQVQPAEVGMLILVTSTGFIAPGVDVAVMKGLGLSPSAPRAVVNFMGCAAAMNGLRLASNFVRGYPGAKALVCCVELSSVNAVWANNINDTIISSLFADGCAAMVVGSTTSAKLVPGKVVIREQFNQFVENSVDGITLGVNCDGITCDLSAKLPLYIRGGLDPVISKVLARHGMAKSDIDLWAIHPGGPKIIEESIRSLGVDEQVATKSWEVLAEHGNMLSASLPFVLKRMLAEARLDKPVSSGVAFSFAPGVTVEGFLFDVVTEEG